MLPIEKSQTLSQFNSSEAKYGIQLEIKNSSMIEQTINIYKIKDIIKYVPDNGLIYLVGKHILCFKKNNQNHQGLSQ